MNKRPFSTYELTVGALVSGVAAGEDTSEDVVVGAGAGELSGVGVVSGVGSGVELGVSAALSLDCGA